MQQIRSILIANRGEVASRIIRTSRRLGIQTVAICSDVDRHLSYTEEADRTICLGGISPAESYLDIAKVISAAQLGEVDAIHPGYGFLAESPDFAEACVAAGFVFVGPSSDAIRAMGSKTNAKMIAEAHQVPTVPGTIIGDAETDVVKRAGELGYPLLVKATAGGGGRGMRLVLEEGSLEDSLVAAQREALAAFGDGTVFVERYMPHARHIEVQIVGDSDGVMLHLGDRDCSLQRRHQKLIEEAPAPGLSDAQRESTRSSAIRLGQAIAYEGVGTVEFLVSGDEYFFLEMNTRLQVEHPVTEAITGLDLVELQLRIASGQPIGVTQEEIEFVGHAIEARLCAEDPSRGHLPSAGQLSQFGWRGAPAARIEQTYRSGDVISVHYDSLVAKVIVHAGNRETARYSLSSQLRRLIAYGPTLNRDLLVTLLEDEVFDSGAATTTSVENAEHLSQSACGPSDLELLAVAAIALGPSPFSSPQLPARRDRYHFELESGQRVRIEAYFSAEELVIVWDGILEKILLLETSDTACRLEVKGIDIDFSFRIEGQKLWVNSYNGQRNVLCHAWSEPDFPEISGNEALAPVQGTVLEIAVDTGDSVILGEKLLILESMKMEHIVEATRSGTVNAVLVEVGAQVAAGSVLVRIDE